MYNLDPGTMTLNCYFPRTMGQMEGEWVGVKDFLCYKKKCKNGSLFKKIGEFGIKKLFKCFGIHFIIKLLITHK